MRSYAVVMAVLVSSVGAGLHGQQRPVLSEAEQTISTEMRGLRKVADGERGEVTRRLAVAIRALPAGSVNRLRLAGGLANLATEGDFGQATLREVSETLAAALRERAAAGGDAKEMEGAFASLAGLARYEGVPVKLELAGYQAALAALEKEDRQRASADFTLTDLAGKSWHLKELGGRWCW